MSTQGIIAVPDGASFRGRYIHSDGYPSQTGRLLRELVDRDGLDKVIQTIVMDHPTGWSVVDPTYSGPLESADVNMVLVPGYGIAYEDEPDHHAWLSPADDRDAEWAYVLTRRGIVVWQNAESWCKRRDLDLRLTPEQLDTLADQEPTGPWWWLVARFWYWSARMRIGG